MSNPHLKPDYCLMKWMALDIGGANLKAADGEQFAAIQPFPLWQNPQQLADALRGLIALVPRVDHIAVTMTGELADCFVTKAEGVKFILDAVSAAADGRHLRVYMTNGLLVAPRIALRQPLLAAASNWHALARFAGRYAPQGTGLVIDVGSTTTDIIPLIDGAPVAMGHTDPKRMLSGELVYTGVERSPLCAVVNALPWRGRKCPIAHELFATTWDVYLMLGDLPEEPSRGNTADRRAATKDTAWDRLARSICADREMFSLADAQAAAEGAAAAQLTRISQGGRARDPAAAGSSGHRRPVGPRRVFGAACHRKAADFSAHRLAPRGTGRGVVSLGDRACTRGAGARGSAMNPSALRVIKLGGSLFDCPDLVERFHAWLSCQPTAANVMIVGGGGLADVLRGIDRRHRLGDATAHRLCIRAMSLTAELAARLLGKAVLTGWPLEARWLGGDDRRLRVVDVSQFIVDDQKRSNDPLPCSWQVTSDSIAARMAAVLRADELVLLKSATPNGSTLEELAAVGFVDRFFPRAAITRPLRIVNLRAKEADERTFAN